MPGPLRTVGGETREWNGSAWVPYTSPPDPRVAAAPPSPLDMVKNFLGGAASTSMFNPMNDVRALVHLPTTLKHIIVDPFTELGQAGTHAYNAITNPGNEGLQGRVTEGAQALEHLMGAIPVAGPAAVQAGNDIGQGDISRGTGELAGLATNLLLPDAADSAPGAIRTIGKGMESAGKSRLGRMAEYGGGLEMLRGDPMKGAAIAVTPSALKYGGRALQWGGDALENLKNAVKEKWNTPPPKPDSTLSGVTLSPDAVARNVEATNMRDVEGFSHAQAGKLSGIPGSGQSSATSVPMGKWTITDEMVKNAQDENGKGGVIPAPGGSIDALKTAAAPDLMDQYMSSLEGGVGSGKQSFEMGGVNYVPDETGSHVAAPAPYDASKELDPAAIEAGYAQNNPVFRALQDQGLFGGNRNTVLNPDVRAAVGNPGLAGLKAAIAPSNAPANDLLETLDPRITGLPPGEAPALTPYADSPTIQYGKSVYPRKDLAAGEFLQQLKDSLAIK